MKRRSWLLASCVTVVAGAPLYGSSFDDPARTAAAYQASAAGFPICHSRASAWARDMTRLAQTRTEVPPAEMQALAPAPNFADVDPPLWDGLGTVGYKITTANREAQAYFDQGLRLAYAFNHGEA